MCANIIEFLRHCVIFSQSVGWSTTLVLRKIFQKLFEDFFGLTTVCDRFFASCLVKLYFKNWAVSTRGNADKCLLLWLLITLPHFSPSPSVFLAEAHLSYFLSGRVLCNSLSQFGDFRVFVQLFKRSSLCVLVHSVFSYAEPDFTCPLFCVTSSFSHFVTLCFLRNYLILLNWLIKDS